MIYLVNMPRVKKNYLFKRFKQSIFLIIILIIISLFLLYKCIIEFQKYLFVKGEYNYSLSQTKDSNNKLNYNQSKLDEINTKEGQDKYIRETYPVKKSGEGLIVLFESPDSTYDIPKAISKWQAFLNYVKSIFHLN